jgi:DNA-binding transcriptional LysR family regulator
MNSRQVECFISAAETLNFTETSKLLFVSQPTVTHSIATLEGELGYKLFSRDKKQVSLTPAGRYLYRSLKVIGSDYRNAVSRARLFGEGYEKELVVGCGSSEFEEQFLPGVVREFRGGHPDVYLRFEMGSIREKIALLQEDKIDLLLTTTAMNLDPRNFAFTQLHTYGMVCVMNREHKLAGAQSLGFDDLAGQNLILLDQACAPSETLELQATLERMYQPNIIAHVRDVRLSHLLMLCDMGVAVMPEFKFTHNEGLVAVPFSGAEQIPYGLVVRQGESRDYVRDLVALLQQRFK